jgi:hypothetical protein
MQKLIFFSSSRRTYDRGNVARGCSTAAAVGKAQPLALPSLCVTNAHVVAMAVGDSPACMHGQALVAIFCHEFLELQ